MKYGARLMCLPSLVTTLNRHIIGLNAELGLADSALTGPAKSRIILNISLGRSFTSTNQLIIVYYDRLIMIID